VEPWSRLPVTDANNYTGVLLPAAEDHMSVLGVAVTTDDYFPIWGLLPPARAALEAAGRTAHLAELGIGAAARVERFMNEDLFALDQVNNLPAGAKDTDEVRRRRQGVLDSAVRQRFARTPHHDPVKAGQGILAKPAQLGKGRPSDTDVVRGLFDSDPDLGKGTYHWYSAGSHATAWEIFKPLTIDASDPMTGYTSGLLARDPREAHLVLSGVLLGYIEAATRVLQLHGWASESWGRAAVNSIRIQREIGELVGRKAHSTVLKP
jgi:hypothetical protein